MMGKTHLITGILLASHIGAGNPTDLYMSFMLGTAIGSLLPDVDHPQAMISRFVPVVGQVIRAVTTHRGFFHSAMGVVSIATFLILIQPFVSVREDQYYIISTGLIIGMILHIAMDAMTNRGVQLLWPFEWRFSLGLMSTGGILEFTFLMIVIIVSVGLHAQKMGFIT